MVLTHRPAMSPLPQLELPTAPVAVCETACETPDCPFDMTGPCSGCPAEIVCHCLQVAEGTIVDTIVELGLRTLQEVRRHTEAGTGCNCCHDRLREYLGVYSSPTPMCSAK